ncbi:acyl-CoA dehydrogenase C-terminal domain-containing protein [Marinicella gelatinilytica]|uniref:acyl-CoA dehydrogenase C-terminal domain-containing protein n=1 Tax=Marinicella gelatinilytica TaxID=2996017 RepID=UPI002260BACD|nr:acyl-CoA dehydrogenase C-terminal domain-containing protein [Marinicella gelatinilytica]MCX7545172.1 acyl-CoA dehydrogenase C-terminal domain-containing protein [Marinicella gelatinilytica]
MANLPAPVKDIQFIVDEVLDLTGHYQKLGVHEELDAETFVTVIDEASKFLHEYVGPLNNPADEQGCRIDGNKVTTPDGFKELYKNYCDSGWSSLDGDPDYGGQGLSSWLQLILGELNTYYCPGWSNYPGLTHGARELLTHFASDELAKMVLPKLTTGEWSGTMCLTEPQCGTDLGMVATAAKPLDDGSYEVTGTKIFITSGEHDLTDNIIHLVLARLPDAPEGTKGISLFLVPKFLINDDLSVGERNGVAAASIEHKMGLNSSATCVMNFDGAKGYLIGQPNEGLKIMFTMMNGARLNTGIQGLAATQASYQNALAYAKDRLQMRAADGPKYPNKPADPIIVHPDVRRMLLTQKAFAEGNRALAYFVGQKLEVIKHSKDADEVKKAEQLVAFLIPIVKGFITETALEATTYGIQVYGGHGYIKEHGQEQWYRDARIFTLYEGTTGIQGLDLVGRKLLYLQKGQIGQMGDIIQDFIDNNDTPFNAQLQKALDAWHDITGFIAKSAMQDANEVGAASVDYMMMSGYVVLAYFWARLHNSAEHNKGQLGADFYAGKQKTAAFYFAKILPRIESCQASIRTGADSLMTIQESEF